MLSNEFQHRRPRWLAGCFQLDGDPEERGVFSVTLNEPESLVFRPGKQNADLVSVRGMRLRLDARFRIRAAVSPIVGSGVYHESSPLVMNSCQAITSAQVHSSQITKAANQFQFMPPSDPHGVPLAPASRSVAYSARPLPMRNVSQEAVGLPTVIVDLASDTQELVERLLEGDASASEKLVQIGDTAITVLASIFPGPITAELRRGSGEGPGRASECGPVLRTLARMGTRPVPFVAVRTADGDPVVRAWATRLLGEMPSAEAAQAVARRLGDGDAEVQRAALGAGQMLLHHPEAAEALQAKIAEAVSDVTRPEDSRHTLIEALAELRAPLVVPTLVRLLEDGSPDIVRSAHWALTVIARQDFATKAARRRRRLPGYGRAE